MGSSEVSEGRRIVARLRRDGDLAEEILGVALEHRVEGGQVWAIGAVRGARIAYYDQHDRAYQELDLDEPLEIASLIGNISLRDGAPALHAHAVFADREGRIYGGHVMPGCSIYACELLLSEFLGKALEREHDETTGLPLWRGL
jgi:hypothetical protein